jgi:hypothetical protein
VRTAEAIAAQAAAPEHQHVLADITDAGAWRRWMPCA